jgi:hypothetical protein
VGCPPRVSDARALERTVTGRQSLPARGRILQRAVAGVRGHEFVARARALDEDSRGARRHLARVPPQLSGGGLVSDVRAPERPAAAQRDIETQPEPRRRRAPNRRRALWDQLDENAYLWLWVTTQATRA